MNSTYIREAREIAEILRREFSLIAKKYDADAEYTPADDRTISLVGRILYLERGMRSFSVQLPEDGRVSSQYFTKKEGLNFEKYALVVILRRGEELPIFDLNWLIENWIFKGVSSEDLAGGVKDLEGPRPPRGL